MEPVPPHNFYRALGGDGPLQHRQLDAERGGRVADDHPPPGSVRSGPRSGGDDLAHVPVQPPCRGIGRHRRPAPRSYRGADRGGGNRRPVRDLRRAGLGDAELAADIYFPVGDRNGFDDAGVASHRAAARTKGRAPVCSRSQRCGLEYQPRRRSGIGGPGDRRTRHGGTLLDQCLEHVRRHRRADLVAPSPADCTIPAHRALPQRDSQRFALRSL
jgi:hypothetical protein